MQPFIPPYPGWSKFPTTIHPSESLDGRKHIANNPDEYEKHTGKKVDWNGQTVAEELEAQIEAPASKSEPEVAPAEEMAPSDPLPSAAITTRQTLDFDEILRATTVDANELLKQENVQQDLLTLSKVPVVPQSRSKKTAN